MIEPADPLVQFDEGSLLIDARLIADGLGLKAAQVPELMRESKITSLYEQGAEGDAGRHRLTFFHEGDQFQLVVDDAGNPIPSSPQI